MRFRFRYSFLIAALALVVVAGCGPKAVEEAPPSPSSELTPSEQLVPLDASGAGSLQRVGIGPYGGYGITPGTPEQRAYDRGLERLAVRVFDSLSGIETYLIVPMYYDKSTTYAVRLAQPEPVPLWSAIESKAVTWWGTPGADVTYHLEDGVLILDHVQSDLAH